MDQYSYEQILKKPLNKKYQDKLKVSNQLKEPKKPKTKKS